MGTLVVTAAARIGGVDDWHGAEARREVWEAVGVVKDDVSASVLVLGLRATGDGLAALAVHEEQMLDVLLADLTRHVQKANEKLRMP